MKRFPSLGQSLARCEFAVAILLTLVPDLLSRAENVLRAGHKIFLVGNGRHLRLSRNRYPERRIVNSVGKWTLTPISGSRS